MSNHPDNFSPAAFDRTHGTAACETAIERAFDDLLFRVTDDAKKGNSQLTDGQRFIDGLVYEQELDGTVYAAIKAAATHLKSRKSMTAEEVGQVLIDALERDLTALAERNAADAE